MIQHTRNGYQFTQQAYTKPHSQDFTWFIKIKVGKK